MSWFWKLRHTRDRPLKRRGVPGQASQRCRQWFAASRDVTGRLRTYEAWLQLDLRRARRQIEELADPFPVETCWPDNTRLARLRATTQRSGAADAKNSTNRVIHRPSNGRCPGGWWCRFRHEWGWGSRKWKLWSWPQEPDRMQLAGHLLRASNAGQSREQRRMLPPGHQLARRVDHPLMRHSCHQAVLTGIDEHCLACIPAAAAKHGMGTGTWMIGWVLCLGNRRASGALYPT